MQISTKEVEEVSSLLTGEEPQETEEQETEEVEEVVEEEVPSQEEEEQETAEEENSPIDYSMPVPMPNGEKVTVGELKDVYQKQSKLMLEMQERENVLMSKQRDAEELLHLVNDKVPPQLRERIQQQQEAYLKQEHQRMLDLIPEFKQEGALLAARDRIFSLAKEYDVEDVIARVSDHRIVKMLNDFSKLREGIRSVEEKVKPKKRDVPVTKKATRSTPKTEIDKMIAKAKSSRNANDETAAIDMLIK